MSNQEAFMNSAKIYVLIRLYYTLKPHRELLATSCISLLLSLLDRACWRLKEKSLYILLAERELALFQSRRQRFRPILHKTTYLLSKHLSTEFIYSNFFIKYVNAQVHHAYMRFAWARVWHTHSWSMTYTGSIAAQKVQFCLTA